MVWGLFFCLVLGSFIHLTEALTDAFTPDYAPKHIFHISSVELKEKLTIAVHITSRQTENKKPISFRKSNRFHFLPDALSSFITER